MKLQGRIILLFRSLLCRRRHIFLALFCVAGTACGILAAHRSDSSLFYLMRMAASGYVSIVGLILSAILPFLFAAFAVYLGQRWLLYILCFARMFLFTFFGCCADWSFGTAGWLVRWLLQFTDGFILVLLCWFSIRHTAGRAGFRQDLFICLMIILAVCAVDYCMISPFLASLI